MSENKGKSLRWMVTMLMLLMVEQQLAQYEYDKKLQRQYGGR
jgi:hypothetical protein